MIYNVGDIARLLVTFTDINKAPADPSTVSVVVQSPDSTIQTYNTPQIVRTGVGTYYFDLPTVQPGIYSYRWIGTGAIVVAPEGAITVAQTIFDGARPSPIDLCTVDQLKSWLNQKNCSFVDINLQREVTAFGAWWLWRTGHGPMDGSVPTVSIFVAPVVFNETYDGNGNDRLFLRQSPITSVQALNCCGLSIPRSTGYNVPGYVIDGNGRSLAIRSSGGGSFGRYGAYSNTRFGSAYRFFRGIQNIQVQYTAGYASTPPDVTAAAIKILGLWITKSRWIGQKQQAQPDGLGTFVYTDLEIPVEVRSVIDFYTRRAAV